DFSGMAVSGSNRGFKLSGQYWHIKGFTIKGAGDNGMYVSGSHNIIEFCSFYENHDTGLQLGGGASNNQIINCDSYYNADPSQGNADGFAPKLDVGTGNYFYGCRAWQNSDDGWDGYLRPSDSIFTTLENCWSFMNGYLKNRSLSSGNGNGFKLGGMDNLADSLRHYMTLKKCLAFDNKVKGFDQNHDRGSITLLNCTAYRNGTNYHIAEALKRGCVLTVKNCVALGDYGSLASFAVQQTNSWMSPFSVSSSDFVSIDTAGVRGPRKADGSLPDVPFMHVAAGSDLIDAGTDVGLPYFGSAPDLGAFEFDTTVVAVNKEQTPLRPEFFLNQNYPNPFNPTTNLRFTIADFRFVRLAVYDILGRKVATLMNERKSPGTYDVNFNASGLSSGVYFYRLTVRPTENRQVGNFVETKKMIIAR
ncbi:MAG: right-handed parallel beta-helix repeat-containing protein, partial [Bacteroidota bacterium]|nr:right-handed parallel beta-helix repeat-containing protein [Bacteroidota bacterium]